MALTTYIVCIPSYKRAQMCNDKTLTMLHYNHISASTIYVYVANQSQYEEYKLILNPKYYNKIIIGVVGLVNQRQFISEEWPEGQYIVELDDDINRVDLSLSPEYKNKSLHVFFNSAFSKCKEEKAYIWGIYPVFNPFFRKGREDMSTCLNYIIGAFYGFINRPKLKLIEVSPTNKFNGNKEDVLRSILYFKEDGIVLRFNKIGFVTKYYNNVGGLGTFNARIKPMSDASKWLHKKYPKYGTIGTKKTGMVEFNLRKIPSKYMNEEKYMEAISEKKQNTTKKVKK